MNLLSPPQNRAKDRSFLAVILAVYAVCLPIGFGRDYFEFQAVQRAAAEHSRALARDAHRYLERGMGRYDANLLSAAGDNRRLAAAVEQYRDGPVPR
jgi:hypothetical protein